MQKRVADSPLKLCGIIDFHPFFDRDFIFLFLRENSLYVNAYLQPVIMIIHQYTYSLKLGKVNQYNWCCGAILFFLR